MPLQIRRGTTAQRLAITPIPGELIYDTTTGQIFVGDGTTAGGATTTGISIENAEDAVAALFTSGSHSGINFTYNDNDRRIDASITTIDTDHVTISDTTESIGLDFRRYIGSVGSFTTTPNNTTLGDIHFYGQTGVEDSSLGGMAAYIQGFVNGTPADGYVPGGIDFHVQEANGFDNPILRLLGGDRYVQVNSSVRLNADAFAPDGIQWMMRQHHSTADANNFSFYRGRGTIASPQAIQNGDDIVDIAFGGYTAFGVYGIGASISAIVDGTVSTNVVPTKLIIRTHNGSASADRITIDKTGAILSTQAILTSAGGIGYTTGAGGTVSQSTSKSTNVTLNKLTGEITTFSDLLAPSTNVVFTLTNTLVTATDHVIVSHIRGGTAGAYNIVANAGNGSVQITIRNITGGSLTEAPILKFTVIKSVNT
jgi:hypothetical protein